MLNLTPLPWMSEALCAQASNPDEWFPDTRYTDAADVKALCAVCPVQPECLAYALAYHEPLEGVWGGLTERERYAIVPRPPKPRSDHPPCGTLSAYRRHFRLGQEPCETCRDANREAKRAQKAITAERRSA